MGVTGIGWTGTPLAQPLVLPRDVWIDGSTKTKLAAGTYPVGTVLPGMTFNPWLGCQKVSRACKHCYAETLVTGRMGYNPTSNDPRRRLTLWGPPATSTRVRTSADNWRKPRRWNAVAADLGVRFKVFCASLADVGEDLDLVRPWRRDLFGLVDATPNLDWLLLTKRTHVLRDEWPAAWRTTTPRNVWVGATVEDQACAHERIPALLDINAAVHWLSCEPLVGELDLLPWLLKGTLLHCPEVEEVGEAEACAGCPGGGQDCSGVWKRQLDWIVLGGESGPGRTTLDLFQVKDLAEQCKSTGVACFVKQDSGAQPGRRGRLSDALWALKQFPVVR